MPGKLSLSQRIQVVHRAMPHTVDWPQHRLVLECLDVEIVLHGGTPPGMSQEVRARVLEEARKFLEEPKV